MSGGVRVVSPDILHKGLPAVRRIGRHESAVGIDESDALGRGEGGDRQVVIGDVFPDERDLSEVVLARRDRRDDGPHALLLGRVEDKSQVLYAGIDRKVAVDAVIRAHDQEEVEAVDALEVLADPERPLISLLAGDAEIDRIGGAVGRCQDLLDPLGIRQLRVLLPLQVVHPHDPERDAVAERGVRVRGPAVLFVGGGSPGPRRRDPPGLATQETESRAAKLQEISRRGPRGFRSGQGCPPGRSRP